MKRQAAFFILAILGFVLLAPPLQAASPQVTISGTSKVTLFGTGTRYASWSTSVTGGYPPYTYQWYWNGSAVSFNGTGSTYGGTYIGPNRNMTITDVVSVVVTDSYGQTATDDHSITVTCYEGSFGPVRE
jgi:hypothetical protein